MIIHHMFVNFKSAYDTIKKPKLYKNDLGIPSNLIKMRWNAHSEFIQEDISLEFDSNRRGVRLLVLFLTTILVYYSIWSSKEPYEIPGVQTAGTIIFDKSSLWDPYEGQEVRAVSNF